MELYSVKAMKLLIALRLKPMFTFIRRQKCHKKHAKIEIVPYKYKSFLRIFTIINQ